MNRNGQGHHPYARPGGEQVPCVWWYLRAFPMGSPFDFLPLLPSLLFVCVRGRDRLVEAVRPGTRYIEIV